MKEHNKARNKKEWIKTCSVTIMEQEETRLRPFTPEETSADVKVSLSEEINSCYLFLFAYAANTMLDFDSVYNQRLWYGKVEQGVSVTCYFAKEHCPLQKGYKVVACLHIPVDEEEYAHVYSQILEVVDEKGERFLDYEYPNVKIDEEHLSVEQKVLHISLTGDERLFQAAREGKISITCAVAQYPSDEPFDFENPRQRSLVSNIRCEHPFLHKEIILNEPLQAGYKVRAVVYWSQNVALLLTKGNDYEEKFDTQDDSVWII